MTITTLDWTARVASAPTVEGVVRIVAAYVQSRSPRFIGDLPAACRPRAMESAQDVSSYAWALVMAQCHPRSNGAAALCDMEHFFSIASLRLSVILRRRGFTARPPEDAHGPEHA